MANQSLSEGQYLATFLDQSDLPLMRHVQDSRARRHDDGDTSFVAHGGLFTGLSAWMGAEDAEIWRVVDIRFLFPDSRAALAYHRERLHTNAEGNPAVLRAEPVGSACKVFGGVRAHPLASDLKMTTYFYVFCTGPMVVKLFAAQSVSIEPGRLTPGHLTPLARRIEQRISQQLPPANP